MPLSIAIITPSYNQGRYLERTIQSVLRQNISNLQYLVMDGGSNDETSQILEKYRDKIDYLSEPDKGQAHAINKGLALSHGEIIGWLNSDDVYLPRALQTVIDFFKQNPAIDVVYGQAMHIDEQDKFINAYATEPWNLRRLRHYCYLAQPAVFFRRQLLEKHGILDENLQYCLDYEYWLRLGLQGARFAYLEHVLAATRLYPQTKTLRDPVATRAEAITMLKKHFAHPPFGWFINFAYTKVYGQKKSLAKGMSAFAKIYWQALHAAYVQEGWYYASIFAMIFPLTALQLFYQLKYRENQQRQITKSYVARLSAS